MAARTSYAILVTNTAGTFTTSVKYGSTLSGGTALPGGGSNLVSGISTPRLNEAIENSMLVCLNDASENA
jgi:hypothetical protein